MRIGLKASILPPLSFMWTAGTQERATLSPCGKISRQIQQAAVDNNPVFVRWINLSELIGLF